MRKLSTRPANNVKPASERSTKRSRKGICLRTFARLSSVQGNGDLSAYKIVFFPHAHVLTAADLTPLQDYVESGGTLVFGCWSAYRDGNHWCYDAPGKAFYEDFVGIRVEDFTVVAPGETSAMRFELSDAPIEAPIFNEVLAPVADDVSVLASYVSDYYAGKPAVTFRQKGQGRVVHFGSFFTPQNVAALLDALAIQDPLRVVGGNPRRGPGHRAGK